VSPGDVGSSPLNAPASKIQLPARTAPIATARSRICDRWWLIGYFSNGRDIGSSVPNGANPLPTVAETPLAELAPKRFVDVSRSSCK
jgi:hypothetical protein